jgi:cytochrome c5
MKKIIIIFFAAFALYSCAKRMTPATSNTAPTSEAKSATILTPVPVAEAKPAEPTPVDIKPAFEPTIKKETTEVTVGKETYKAKCGRCHNLKDPENYTAIRWVKIIDWMAPKAQLKTSEKENVLAYVSFYAKV